MLRSGLLEEIWCSGDVLSAVAQSKRDDFLQKGSFWSFQVCLESRLIEPQSFSVFTFAGRMMWDLLMEPVLFGPFPL